MKTICPQCNQEVEIPDDQLGQSVTCSACNAAFTAEEPKTCRHCNTLNPRSATRCSSCGKSLIGIAFKRGAGEVGNATETPAPAPEAPAKPAAPRIGIKKPGQMNQDAPAPAPAQEAPVPAPEAPAAQEAPEPAPQEEVKPAIQKMTLKLPGKPAEAPAETPAPAVSAPKLSMPKIEIKKPAISVPSPAPAPAPAQEEKAEETPAAQPAPVLNKPSLSIPKTAAGGAPKLNLTAPAPAPVPAPAAPAPEPAQTEAHQDEAQEETPAAKSSSAKKILLTASIAASTLLVLGAGAYAANWYLNGPYDPAEQLRKAIELASEGKKEKAAAMLIRSMEQGNTEAAFLLGGYYQKGEGIPADMAKAVSCYETAAKAGNHNAEFILAGLYENGTGVEKDLKKAFEYYLAAANGNHQQAIKETARCYEFGIGTEKDPVKALPMKIKAADSGDTDAQFFVANVMLVENTSAYNPVKAAEYLAMASASQHFKASYMLGELLRKGIGTGEKTKEQITAETEEAYKKAFADASAAAEENPDAMFITAKCMYYGYGTEEDDAKAKALLSQLLDRKDIQPDPEAWYLMAMLSDEKSPERKEFLKKSAEAGLPGGEYEYALTLTKPEEIAEWLEKAVASDYAPAYYELAKLLFHSDPVRSLDYLKTAVEKKDHRCNYLMGMFCEHGLAGVPQDMKKAISLYWAAAKDEENPSAEASGKLNELFGKGVEQKYMLSLFEQDAKKNNPEAKKRMAKIYREGTLLKKDLKKAVQYFWDAGDVESLFDMLKEKEETKSILEHFDKAAQDGDKDMQRKLADLYLDGKIVKRNARKAVSMLKKLAEAGSTEDQYQLARMLYQEDGRELSYNDRALTYKSVDKDRKDAAGYFRKAADAGHADAQFRYAKHLDLTKKSEEAAKYYQLAAEQGHTPALFQQALQQLELSGAKDLDPETKKAHLQKAYELLTSAAEKNYAPALFAMGELSAQTGNKEKADAWYAKAAEADYVPAIIILNQAQTKQNRKLIEAAAKAGYLPAVAEEAVYLYEQENNGQEAKEKYEKIVKLFPAVSNNMAVCLYESNSIKQADHARKLFAAVAKKDKKPAAALFNLAICYFKDEIPKKEPDYKQVLEMLEQVEKLNDPEVKVSRKIKRALTLVMKKEKEFREVQQAEEVLRKKGSKDLTLPEEERKKFNELGVQKAKLHKELNQLSDFLRKELQWKLNHSFADEFHTHTPQIRYPWIPDANILILKDLHK